MPTAGSGADVVRPNMTLFERARLHPKMLILVVVCLCLAGVLVVSLSREVTSTRKPVAASRALEPTRPPLSPAEEEYIGLLWPIHGDVERSTAVMSLGEIFYLNKDPDMSKEKFKKRVLVPIEFLPYYYLIILHPK